MICFTTSTPTPVWLACYAIEAEYQVFTNLVPFLSLKFTKKLSGKGRKEKKKKEKKFTKKLHSLLFHTYQNV